MERRREGTNGGRSKEALEQCFLAVTWQCQEGEFSREMDNIYWVLQVWLILGILWCAFNCKMAEECFYLSLITLPPNLSFASEASNSSINSEHTGKELRAGKLPSQGCLPPLSCSGLSAAGEAAQAGGEGLCRGLIGQRLDFLREACFVCIPNRAVFVHLFFRWQLFFDCACLPNGLWLRTFYLQNLCHCHE